MAKQIPLSKGFHALVDDADFEWLSQWNWSANFDSRKDIPRATRSVSLAERLTKGVPRTLHMHRFILSARPGEEVDHINGNSLDNRRANLRIVSRSDNLRNRRTFKTNKAGFKGVRFEKSTGAWQATLFLGNFASAEEAARAYDAAALAVYGDVAHLNFAAQDANE